MHGVWHAHVAGVHPGQHYGFRTHGPWDPARGLRHNPAKLLVDPYARGLSGALGTARRRSGTSSTPPGTATVTARRTPGTRSGRCRTRVVVDTTAPR